MDDLDEEDYEDASGEDRNGANEAGTIIGAQSQLTK